MEGKKERISKLKIEEISSLNNRDERERDTSDVSDYNYRPIFKLSSTEREERFWAGKVFGKIVAANIW